MLTWNVEFAAGRIVLHGEPDGTSQLRLLNAADDEILVPVAERGRHARAVIALEALKPGRWRVEGASLADGGRTGPAVVSPIGGSIRRVRLRADAEGRLELDVASISRHAEVRRLRLSGTTLELSLPEPGTVVARSRAESAGVAGGEGRLDLSLLALDGSGDEAWRLWLDTPGGERLRIARHLDGVPGKRKRAALPSLATGGGRIQLRYTDEDQLAVTLEPPLDDARPREAKPVSRRRRALGGPAVVAHRVALGALARLPGPRRVERTGAPAVRFVLANAFGVGGTIRATVNLAGELSERREVEIISVRRHLARPFFAPPERVSVSSLVDNTARRSPLERVLAALPSVLVHPEDYAYPGSSLLTDVRLVRRLRRSGGDVIVTTRPAYALIAVAAAPPDAIVIAQEHLHLGAHRPRLGRAIRRSYGKLDALTVLTDADRGAYTAALNGSSTHVVRLPGVRVPHGDARSDTTQPVVVAAGRLTQQKGFDLLLRAFAPIARAHDEWQLRIYGGGPDDDALRAQIVAERLHDNVLLMGSTRDLGDAMAAGAIFAFSSRFEGFGMVVVEAMSRGLPVVSFACPHGPSEVISHGDDGLLVAPEDVDGLTAAIEALVVDPQRRARMGAAALETAKAYETARLSADWETLLSRLGAAG